MAYITFTDEVGSVTITSSYPAGPARRFRNWTPDAKAIGPKTVALGTGRTYQFRFRTDYVASFQISGVTPEQHEDFMRFKLWATKGCVFEVYTEDVNNNYYECRLAPETEPSLELDDTVTLEYTISVNARSVSGTPMVCNYRG